MLHDQSAASVLRVSGVWILLVSADLDCVLGLLQAVCWSEAGGRCSGGCGAAVGAGWKQAARGGAKAIADFQVSGMAGGLTLPVARVVQVSGCPDPEYQQEVAVEGGVIAMCNDVCRRYPVNMQRAGREAKALVRWALHRRTK